MSPKPRRRGDHRLTPRRQAVLYARVSSKEQEKEGFSIPSQLSSCADYAAAQRPRRRPRVRRRRDRQADRARRASARCSRSSSGHPTCRVLLVEKTDRLYRNLKDWVTLDEIDLEIHLVKENVVLSRDSRSSEKFMHGIKVLMAKNYIDNLSEETRKGMLEKAEQGIWPTYAPARLPQRHRAGRQEGHRARPDVAPARRPPLRVVRHRQLLDRGGRRRWPGTRA